MVMLPVSPGTSDTVDGGREAFGGISLHVGKDRGVDVLREGRRGVADPLGDDLDRDSRAEHRRDGRVADVMEPDLRKAGPGDEAAEGMGDFIRVEVGPVLPAEKRGSRLRRPGPRPAVPRSGGHGAYGELRP